MSKSVCVVDNDSVTLKKIEDFFADFDYTVSGLDLSDPIFDLTDLAPNAIFINIDHPQLNGFSLCNRIKRNAATKSICVVLVAENSSEQAVETHRASPTPADYYFRKPLHINDLNTVYQERLLKKKRRRRKKKSSSEESLARPPKRTTSPGMAFDDFASDPASLSTRSRTHHSAQADDWDALPEGFVQEEQSSKNPAPPPRAPKIDLVFGVGLMELVQQKKGPSHRENTSIDADRETFLRNALKDKEDDFELAELFWSQQNQQLEALTEQVAELERANQSLSQVKEDAIEQIQNLEDRLATLQTDFEMIHERANRLDDEKRHQERSLADAQDKAEATAHELRTLLDEKEQELKAAVQLSLQRNAELDALRNKLEHVEIDLVNTEQGATKEIESLTNQLEQSHKENEELSQLLKVKQNDLREAKETHENQLETIVHLQEKVRNAQRVREELTAEHNQNLQALEYEQQQLRAQLNEKEQSYKEAREALETLEQNYKESKDTQQELQSAYDRLNADHIGATHQIESLVERKKLLEGDLNNLQSHSTNLENQLRKLEAVQRETASELGVLKSENDVANKRLIEADAAFEALNQKHQNQVQVWKKEHQARKVVGKELANTKDELQSALAELKTLNAAHQGLEADHQKMTASFEQTKEEFAQLTLNHSALHKERNALRTDLVDRDKRIEKLSERFSTMKAETEKHLGDLKAKHQKTQSDLSAELNATQQRLAERQAQLDKTTTERSELQNQYTKLLSDYKELQHTRLAEREQHKEALTKVSNGFQKYRDKAKEKLFSTEEEIKKIEADKSDLERIVAQLQHDNNVLAEDGEHLKGRLKSLSEELKLNKDALAEKQNNLFELKSRLQEAKKVIQDKNAALEVSTERLKSQKAKAGAEVHALNASLQHAKENFNDLKNKYLQERKKIEKLMAERERVLKQQESYDALARKIQRQQQAFEDERLHWQEKYDALDARHQKVMRAIRKSASKS